MKIGIIGAGYIGATTARLFVAAGHEVAISNSRGPETLEGLIEELGPNAHATTPAGAAEFGEVVLLAIPLKDYKAIPAEPLRGKIVVDALNYYPERDNHFEHLDSGQTTSSEMVSEHLPGVRLVKGFNTIWYEHLRTKGNMDAPVEKRRAIFLAGDDAEAKKVVKGLIESIGFGVVDTGSLSDGRKQQPDSAVYNKDVTVEEGRKLLGK